MVEKGVALAEKYKAPYKYVECKLEDRDEINHRLGTRKRMPSQIAQASSEEAFRAAVNGSKRPPGVHCLVIDSFCPLDSYIDTVTAYIAE
jgi:hypothetical protein